MAKLPHDLIYEILLWLPVKTLLRFRCVCKSWYEIIDSPDFINSHLRTSSDNRLHNKLIRVKLMHHNHTIFRATNINDGFQEEFQLDDQITYTGLDADCCNGLILLNPSPDKIFSIWNPSTRNYRKLPDFPATLPVVSDRRDRRSGLGYDSSTNDYKVVQIIPTTTSYQVWIFTLRLNYWRRIQDFPYIDYDEIHTLRAGTCFVDGCIHFLCAGNHQKLPAIVAFDVVKETFSLVPLPTYEGKGHPTCLESFDGCLSIRFYTNEQVDLYVRKKAGVEFTWTRLFSITSEQSFVFGRGFFNIRFETLGYSKDGCKILLFFVGKVFSYDLKKASLEILETPSLCNLYNSIYCVESLVSI